MIDGIPEHDKRAIEASRLVHDNGRLYTDAEMAAFHKRSRRLEQKRAWYDKNKKTIGGTSRKGMKHKYPKGRRSKSNTLFFKAADSLKLTEDERRGKKPKRGSHTRPADEHKPSQAELKRERHLALIPADRRCPVCTKLFIKSHAWVTFKAVAAGVDPCCMACYRKGVLGWQSTCKPGPKAKFSLIRLIPKGTKKQTWNPDIDCVGDAWLGYT